MILTSSVPPNSSTYNATAPSFPDVREMETRVTHTHTQMYVYARSHTKNKPKSLIIMRSQPKKTTKKTKKKATQTGHPKTTDFFFPAAVSSPCFFVSIGLPVGARPAAAAAFHQPPAPTVTAV